MNSNHLPPNTLPDSRLVISALERTPAALEARNEGHSRNRAIGNAAFTLIDSKPDEKYSLNDYGLKILAELPDYLEATTKLDRLKWRVAQGEESPREEKAELLKKIIPYNHTLREMLDHYPRLSLSQITDFVASSVLITNDPSTADLAGNRTRDALNGMRHEVALEGVLYNIEGVDDVVNAEIDDDLRGTDLIVMYKGKHIKLDVKASSRRAHEKAHIELEYAKTNPPIPIWSGFSNKDFGDSLRITDQQAIADRAVFVGQLLEEAYQNGSRNALNMVLYDENDTRIHS